jgi:arylformamidase
LTRYGGNREVTMKRRIMLPAIGLVIAAGAGWLLAGTANDVFIRFRLSDVYEAPGVKSGVLLEATGDGVLDLVLAAGGAYAVLEGWGDGPFEQLSITPSSNSTGWGLHDFNADGRMDLYLSQEEGPDVLINQGDGTLAPMELGLEGEGVVRTALFADFDGDGADDAYLSTSAFNTRHAWNRLHPGLPDRTFAANVIDSILDPAIPEFWHAFADGPAGCTGEWSSKQFKGAIVRDFDGDGKPDIVATAYADRGFQDADCERWAQGWVEEQERGIFVFQNTSTPGQIRFREVAKTAIGADAHGATADDWNPYQATPLDYDRDGDLDLFVGAVLRGNAVLGTEDTDAVRLFENVSVPGEIRFLDRTEQAGLGYINAPAPAERSERSLAAAAPIDLDNDGWVDLVAINRRDADKTSYGYAHVFRNLGNGSFEEISPQAHGMADGAGGRDLTYGDLNGDGLLDVVVMDGNVGGYEGMDNTRVYLNRTVTDNHWLQIEVHANDAGSPAIGAKVSILDSVSGQLLGHDELRTDFSYRCKRPPVLHFGLGDAAAVVVVVEHEGRGFRVETEAVDRTMVIDLTRTVEEQTEVADAREDADCSSHGMVVHRDLAYASIPSADPDSLSLDVYEPIREPDCPAAPVMIYVHGGGWAKGDRSAVHLKAEAFAESGYVFVSTNYRMTPQVEFPVHAEDVARAIAWVVEHVDEYGGDPDRVFLMGHSAGAHLVSLVATDARYLEGVGLGLNALSGVISNDTQAYDIAWLATQQGGTLQDVYAATFSEDPAFWAFASPTTHVAAGKGIAPFLILYSGGMSQLRASPQRAEAADAFAHALREAGVSAEVVGAPERTHSEINREIGEPGNAVTGVVFGFLDHAEDASPCIACREILPSSTDSRITDWDEPHYVCAPEDLAAADGRLWVFLPGTGAKPSDYRLLTEHAAKAGLHAICLRYPNDESVNLQICPFDQDEGCHGDVREEVVNGIDASRHVEVNAANSIVGRLKSLLAALVLAHPDEGWERFVDPEGFVAWDRIVISGHSQGAGHAAYIAYQHAVDHVVLFAWVDVRRGELAPWLVEKTSATASDNYYVFWHAEDARVTRNADLLLVGLGLAPYRSSVIVDGNSPPYSGSHSLIATAAAPEGQLPHNAHVVDWALALDEHGEPAYADAWTYLITVRGDSALPDSPPDPQVRVAVSVQLGSDGRSYIDPEFLDSLNLVTFVDGDRRVWLAELDPETGEMIPEGGMGTLIAEDVTPLSVSMNGPEFGVDQYGWALYFTKAADGLPQPWSARFSREGELVAEPIVSTGPTRLSILASKDHTADTTYLLYAYGGDWGEGLVTYLDASEPLSTERSIPSTDTGARWIDGTSRFTFVYDDGPYVGQVGVHDAQRGITRPVTHTPSEKSNPYGWYAPEAEALMMLAVSDGSSIEVWRETADGTWQAYAQLRTPEGSAYSIIGSPEPFVVGERSYISLVIKSDSGYAPAEVWALSLDGQSAIRCEDDQATAIRTDPEVYVSGSGAFLYYNLLRRDADGVRFELYRCLLPLE